MSTRIYFMLLNLSVFDVITEWPNKEAWNIFESFVTQNVSPYLRVRAHPPTQMTGTSQAVIDQLLSLNGHINVQMIPRAKLSGGVLPLGSFMADPTELNVVHVPTMANDDKWTNLGLVVPGPNSWVRLGVGSLPQKPEVMQEVERYRLEIVRLTSEYCVDSGTQYLKRSLSFHDSICPRKRRRAGVVCSSPAQLLDLGLQLVLSLQWHTPECVQVFPSQVM